ncbi:MAG: ABC transporter ATP-binding protein [Eggerthella sp.]|nr:ABC transporter ATP-binding protein [Eggerthella sp.]
MSSNEPKPNLGDAKNLHKTSVSNEVVIRFDHVTKTYNLYKNDKARFLGIFNIRKEGMFLGSVNASDDLSFEIRKGEAVAFLGRNGAGKSTALKMVTGVTHPTEGTVEVRGRVSALLELTAGFDKQLTGRENIALRGQILGLMREEIKEIEPKVIDFAELGVYIDQPMRTYSSGMKARLGFAFAVAIDPEILVVDEALSVGDRAFQRKCIARIREIMMDENVTVLFVTHASATAKEFCSRGLVLDHGKCVYDSTIEDATAYYEKNY